MTDIERIRLAEQRVDTVQQALTAVQHGLHTAEEVSVAVHQARHSLRKLLVAALVIGGIAAVVTLVVRVRSRSATPTEEIDA